MSHLVRVADDKRISLETVHVRPNVPLTVGVWGMVNGLELVPTLDSAWDESKVKREATSAEAALGQVAPANLCRTNVVPAPPKKDYYVKQFTFPKSGNFRIELRMGIHVWDWMRVACSPTVPGEHANLGAKGSGVLNLHVIWATDKAPAANPLPHYITVASLLLEKHGFKLSITPGSAYYDSPRIRGFEAGVVCQKDYGNMQGLAAALKNNPVYAAGKKLVVVMANARETIEAWKDDGRLTGQAVMQDVTGGNPPFIILNVNSRSVDGATLVHEMGHAAGFCEHSSAQAHVMSYGPRRNQLPKRHITDFQNAFFRTA
jgi:hypothetical protein